MVNVRRLRLLTLFLVTMGLLAMGGQDMATADDGRSRHVILLGASVGKTWNLPEFEKRVGEIAYSLEYAGCYRFDKSEPLQEFLDRAEEKPDAIILKECGAYFPSDISFEDSRKLMMGWIDKVRDFGVVPIPATVAPVTRELDEDFKTTNPLKRLVKRMLGISMMTRMDRISEYNDWLKEYCDAQGIVYLDLEGPLLISPEERFLRPDLTSGDGLHLNSSAYEILDQVLIPTLDRAFSTD